GGWGGGGGGVGGVGGGGGGGAGAGGVANLGGGKVGRGGGQRADGVGAPVAVLVDAGHRQGVKRLDEQRPQARHESGQVGAHLPGDAGGPEEAVIGRIGGHA